MDSLFMKHPETLEPVRADLLLPVDRWGALHPGWESAFELVGLFAWRRGAWQPCGVEERAMLEALLPGMIQIHWHSRLWSDLPVHLLYRAEAA